MQYLALRVFITCLIHGMIFICGQAVVVDDGFVTPTPVQAHSVSAIDKAKAIAQAHYDKGGDA